MNKIHALEARYTLYWARVKSNDSSVSDMRQDLPLIHLKIMRSIHILTSLIGIAKSQPISAKYIHSSARVDYYGSNHARSWQESNLFCRSLHAEGRLAIFKTRREWHELNEKAIEEGYVNAWIDGKRARKSTHGDFTEIEFVDEHGTPVDMYTNFRKTKSNNETRNFSKAQ